MFPGPVAVGPIGRSAEVDMNSRAGVILTCAGTEIPACRMADAIEEKAESAEAEMALSGCKTRMLW